MSCCWWLQLFNVYIFSSKVLLYRGSYSWYWFFYNRLFFFVISLMFNLFYFSYIAFVFIILFIKYGIGGTALFDDIQKGWVPNDFSPIVPPNGTVPVQQNPTTGPGVMNKPPPPPDQMMMPRYSAGPGGMMPRYPGEPGGMMPRYPVGPGGMMPRYPVGPGGMMPRYPPGPGGMMPRYPPGPGGMMPGPHGSMMMPGPRGQMVMPYPQGPMPGYYPQQGPNPAHY
jgi:hypothetical protein